ncbi:hypothetical protein PLICRDRAFT_38206 [Plicaturopsis crispa FD-325 SS-3]|nr:hypothetical protein PLICRDRAFT_38206 [Plicaturopsis crispa FD-325 SS-3]
MSSTPPAGYAFLDAPPSLEDYLSLRRANGLSTKSPAQGAGAISGSWAFSTIVYTPPSDSTTSASDSAPPSVVGMIRAIGDGGWYFVIADMAVLPAHRRKGLGEALLQRMLHKIKTETPPGVLITLSADAMGVPLYKRNGFVETAPSSIGMWLPVDSAHAGKDSTGVDEG